MSHSKPAGLDYEELLILSKNNGYLVKKKIGGFVDSYFADDEEISNPAFEKISGFHVISFNPNTYSYEKEEIIGVTKAKSDFVYNMIFDDNSHIRIAENTVCYKFENCIIEEIKAKDVQLGDYSPLSNCGLQTQNNVLYINLLESNENRKVNIKNLIENYPEKFNFIDTFLRNEFANTDWKLKNILGETKERGLKINQLNKLLFHLDLTLEEVNHCIRIITKGKDILNPLIPISQDFAFFSGLYLAEGNLTSRTIRISNSNKSLQKKCKQFAINHNIRFYQNNKNDIAFHSVLFTNLLKEMGKNAYQKNIPSLFYNISQDLLSVFLQAIFDGDGWVESNSICYLSASSDLVFDIKNLLLHFTISSRVREKNVNYKNNYGIVIPKRYYLLTISGKRNLEIFLKKISFSLKYKEDALKKAIKPSANTNVDLIPNCGSYFKSLRIKNNLSQKDLASHARCQRSYISLIENNRRFPSKLIFDKLIDFDENNKQLRNLLNFNFRYVVRINREKATNGFVYGLITKGNQCFSAGNGNIFVHIKRRIL